MSTATPDRLDKGREAFAGQRWDEAVEHLSAADAEISLGPEDLYLLATAASLTGDDAGTVDLGTRAYHGFVDASMPERAARCAYHIGMSLMNRGEVAQAGGWFGRMRQILDDGARDCVELGYLQVPIALQSLFAGDAAAAYEAFGPAQERAERFKEPDLMAMCKLGRGQALINLGRVPEGVAMHDEAMTSVMAGEVSPIVSGIVYCAVIEACQEIFDVARAQEWTDALKRWTSTQHGLVAFRGQCLVHRAHLMQLHGAWPEALEEAERAQHRLSSPPQPAVGAAYYQLAEIHRLRGDIDKAQEAYRDGSQWGRSPQPGLALLRLAQGQSAAAKAALGRELDEAKEPFARSALLPAYVEVTLACGDVSAARASADELAKIATMLDVPYARAVAAQAGGAVSLAEGDARGAVQQLRSAWTAWQEVRAPYEAARARVLIGNACRMLEDDDTAAMEFDAARHVFSELGAIPALTELDALTGKGPKAAGGLSPREVEVLRLVSAGKTNRAIANELVLSEKTVARHVSNIFTKLGVSSRAAATAYAYEHDLV